MFILIERKICCKGKRYVMRSPQNATFLSLISHAFYQHKHSNGFLLTSLAMVETSTVE